MNGRSARKSEARSHERNPSQTALVSIHNSPDVDGDILDKRESQCLFSDAMVQSIGDKSASVFWIGCSYVSQPIRGGRDTIRAPILGVACGRINSRRLCAGAIYRNR